MIRAIRGLYAITLETADTGLLKEQVAAALRGGARAVQYRNKSASRGLRLTQARAIAELAAAADATVIINDYPDLAVASGAGGVHLGREDADIEAARRRLGPDALIGVSCYNELERAVAARDVGADYVAFGSFYPSPTKPHAVAAPVELLQRARSRGLGVPIVAIGGIDAANAAALISAGADAVAVASGLFLANDIEAAARALAGLFAED